VCGETSGYRRASHELLGKLPLMFRCQTHHQSCQLLTALSDNIDQGRILRALQLLVNAGATI
jgi:hypothetical protein